MTFSIWTQICTMSRFSFFTMFHSVIAIYRNELNTSSRVEQILDRIDWAAIWRDFKVSYTIHNQKPPRCLFLMTSYVESLAWSHEYVRQVIMYAHWRTLYNGTLNKEQILWRAGLGRMLYEWRTGALLDWCWRKFGYQIDQM